MNQIKWKTKAFDELCVSEIYEILQLRNEIFIVEQNCVYQDIDSKDQKSWHLMGFFQNKIIAYSRLFKPNDYFEQASFGRVIVKKNFRDQNYGHLLIVQAIFEIDRIFKEKKLTISAQLYLQRFYESHGFVITGEIYLEDNIEHIQMKKI